MPYPTQINKETILQHTSDLIEKDGLEALSLHKLATTLGVKAPSLYRHIGNKNQLLQTVNLATLQTLFATMHEAIEQAPDDPFAQIEALSAAYRRYAQQHPQLYMLAFTHKSEGVRPDEALLTAMVLPIQEIMAAISGETNALAALRGALALIHGFVMLELNEQLQRGGNLDDAFAQAVHAYLRGWQKTS